MLAWRSERSQAQGSLTMQASKGLDPASLGLGSPCEHGSYKVLRLFNSAELNDRESVSVLLKNPGTILGLPFQSSVADS